MEGFFINTESFKIIVNGFIATDIIYIIALQFLRNCFDYYLLILPNKYQLVN